MILMGDCGNESCGWRGDVSQCLYLGSVGPCCPECHEIVEPDELKPSIFSHMTKKQSDLEADAARYRWLRHEHEIINPLAAIVWKQNDMRNGSDWVNVSGPIELDREIDRQIALKPI